MNFLSLHNAGSNFHHIIKPVERQNDDSSNYSNTWQHLRWSSPSSPRNLSQDNEKNNNNKKSSQDVDAGVSNRLLDFLGQLDRPRLNSGPHRLRATCRTVLLWQTGMCLKLQILWMTLLSVYRIILSMWLGTLALVLITSYPPYKSGSSPIRSPG